MVKKDPTPPFDLSAIMEIPGPKKPSTAFIMYSVEYQSKVEKGENFKLGQMMKEIAEEWKKTDENTQAKYQKLADQDKARFKAQMLQFEQQGFFFNEDGLQSNHVIPQKPKFHDHVVLPKRGQTSYFFFLAEANPANREKNPDIAWKDVLKMSGEQWNDLPKKNRKKYETLADADRLRYESDLKELLTKGFFIMPDGSKSSDHQAKKKVKRAAKNAENTQQDEEDGSEEKEETKKRSNKRKAAGTDDEDYQEKPKKR